MRVWDPPRDRWVVPLHAPEAIYDCSAEVHEAPSTFNL
jgi:hypothetical protein